MKRSVIFVLMVMLISAVAAAKPAEPPIVAKCKADLAKRLEVKAQDIKTIEAAPITWPDASLGMPEIGKSYAQVLTPGYRIVLNSGNVDYLYTASPKTFKYGHQKASWYGSVLYLKAKPNDANLNGDLYQCSLMGTNTKLIASGVSDYYPQEKGAILFTRRTSRSGFDLLAVRAGVDRGQLILHSALGFGDADIDDEGKQWAAFERPGLGSGWKVTIGQLSVTKSDKQTLDLPDGVTPDQIAWVDGNVMIMTKKGQKVLYYEISPKAEKPEWQESADWRFPKTPDFMLNKSESLLVDQVDDNGKPVVEIGTIWFTGDRTVNARIENFTMRGVDFPLANLYVFVRGEKGGKPAAYSVDYERGDIIALPQAIASNVKPFNFPPQSNPLFAKK